MLFFLSRSGDGAEGVDDPLQYFFAVTRSLRFPIYHVLLRQALHFLHTFRSSLLLPLSHVFFFSSYFSLIFRYSTYLQSLHQTCAKSIAPASFSYPAPPFRWTSPFFFENSPLHQTVSAVGVRCFLYICL